MDSPLQAILEGLRTGRPSLEALAALGEADPEAAAGSLRDAAEHPHLAPARELWLEPLLTTARPGFAARTLAELAERTRQTRGEALRRDALPALVRVLGSSDFLARLLLRHPHWVEDLAGDPPLPPRAPVEPDWTAIRLAKYRGLLRVAARDLLGRPFEQGLAELSDLADRCLDAALSLATEGTAVPAPSLLALGKLGGRELNFSSDVDLIAIYGGGRDDLEHNSAVGRVVQALKTGLEAPSEDGFGYRVDLGLRPEGRTGALANSVEAALDYYETFGAEWERQALIRLRHVAGPAAPARDFAAGVAPFVYRQAIDPGAIQRVRERKRQIEDERRRVGRDLESDLKEGPGGIRDVEFLVQAHQLFHGAREPSLRTGNVLAALDGLLRLRLLPEAAVASLTDGYTWLRRAEHALQLVEERQTARVPRDRPGRLGLARRMGYADPVAARALDRFLDDWTRVRANVRGHFENLLPEERDGRG